MLGVSGANWTEGGVNGVEIMDVAPDSAAETARLRVGYVITDVNGRHIRSTEDLAGVLAQNGPSSRITVGYIVKTNLGWMPSEATAVLTNK
jgi:S1-C subfamily serine protease